jgi:hypothetical protein
MSWKGSLAPLSAAHVLGGGRGFRSRFVVGLVLGVVLLLVGAGPAFGSAQWLLEGNANSSSTAGTRMLYHVQLANIGDDPADGTSGDPIVFGGSLPAHVTLDNIAVVAPPFGTFDWSFLGWVCTGDGGGSPGMVGAHTFSCTINGSFGPHTAVLRPLFFVAQPLVTVNVDGGASGTIESGFTLSGAGAAPVRTFEATRITNAAPEFGVNAFDGAVAADPAGSPFTQAGGHPFAASTSIEFNTETNPNPLIGDLWPVAAPKTVEVNLPPGLIGYPRAAAKCSSGELAASDRPLCPVTSQVGTTVLHVNGTQTDSVIGPFPVFNMESPPDVPARFGFNVLGVVVTLDAQVRPSDYGITILAHNLPEGLAFSSTSVTLWGYPSDEAHRPERGCPDRIAPQYTSSHGPTCFSGAAHLPFLRNPTSCPEPGSGFETSLRVDSWADPGRFATARFTSHDNPGYPRASANWGDPLGTTGCNDVPFNPTFNAAPTQPARAGAPTGFAFDLNMPQDLDPRNLVAQSDLKKAVVTLPVGVRVSPASAAGLGACSPDQIRLHTLDEPTCPPSSKVGDVVLTTPLLDDALTGAVYLATPFNNPFNKLLSLYIVVRGHGVLIKLPGQVDSNPENGQLTATFDENPQAPFTNLHLQFTDGPRSPLTTPDQCGTYTTHAEFLGWSGASARSESSFTLAQDADGSPCKAHGFDPGFSAGTQDPVAGKTTSFHLRITRPDQNQALAGVSVHLPEGLLGYISHTTLCDEAHAHAGTCTDASKVGDVTVGSGAGPNPFYITNGRAYITGPYKGAPFGLSIVVPAVAGPFNLGNVNVRSAFYVDKLNATVRVVSDPLPTILQGIPLDVQDVRVDVNRPDFIVNPTSCAEKTIAGTLTSIGGIQRAVSSRFQLGDCAALGFTPRMVLRVGGAGHTARNATTPLATMVTMPPGQTNLRSVQVTLPKAINARLTVINDACTRAEFDASLTNCAHARAGVASAITPLLDDPVQGNVYFVKNGHAIPDIFVALRGQVDFNLIGRVSIIRNTFLRTTFDAAPDVPIRSFTLRLAGDPKNGSVGAAANLCTARSRRQKAQLDYTAQNGTTLHINQGLKVGGCGKAHRRKH